MVKLIASDLDGTLLPPTKILPEETFPLIEKLADMGVTFAPASGRQLPNLKKLFAPVSDRIAIIAENGGLVYCNGRIIFSDPTPKDGVRRALNAVRKESGLYPVISCADCAYIEDTYPRFLEVFKKSFTSYEIVENLDDIANSKSAIKVSIWDDELAAEHGGKILPPKLKGLRTMVSGRDWLDVSSEKANKGRALNALMNYLGVTREECAAFGDHMNDKEMLEACAYPYVTANAFPALKASIGEEIESNADFGVIKKIKQIYSL